LTELSYGRVVGAHNWKLIAIEFGYNMIYNIIEVCITGGHQGCSDLACGIKHEENLPVQAACVKDQEMSLRACTSQRAATTPKA
jgi:hypothetical protein